MSEVMIPGPVGLIEGKLYINENRASTPLVVVFHPHPLHGGTMNNKVVHALFKTFRHCHFNVLKINFRGVGKSQGTAVGGDEELDDALTVLDWFIKKCPENPEIWVAGFSFGGWIALQVAMRRPEVTGFISVSPPVEMYPFNMLTPCPSGLIMQGENDHIVSLESVKDLSTQLIRQKGCEIEFLSMEADHYFTNKLIDLEEILIDYVDGRFL